MSENEENTKSVIPPSGGIYGMFKSAPQFEKNGVWLKYESTDEEGNDNSVSFLVARAGGTNTSFAKAVNRHSKPYRRLIELEKITPNQTRVIMVQSYADAIILGWQGVTDEKGNNLPFNRENVVKVMTDLPDLFLDIQSQATKASLFREELLKGQAGN